MAVSIWPSCLGRMEVQDGDAIFRALPASMGIKWRRAIQELVITERTYITELNTIMRGYIHVIPDQV